MIKQQPDIRVYYVPKKTNWVDVVGGALALSLAIAFFFYILPAVLVN